MEPLPDVAEITRLRQTLGITQQKLANELDIPRGTMARIESKKYNPNYNSFKKIVDYLYNKKYEINKPLDEICNKNIVFVSKNASLMKAIKIMQEKRFDAIPVLDGKTLRGKITIYDALKSQNRKLKISSVMSEAPPTVPYDTPISQVRNFLTRSGDCLILTKNGQYYGIVDPWDLITKKSK
jgi:predicted transcriptional regulator